MAGTGIQVIFAPGNDDPFFVDPLLSSSSLVTNPDQRVVELPGGFPMISVGYSNRTPWASPRELDEDDLAKLTPENLDEFFAVDSAVYTPEDAAAVQQGYEMYDEEDLEDEGSGRNEGT